MVENSPSLAALLMRPVAPWRENHTMVCMAEDRTALPPLEKYSQARAKQAS